MSSCGRLCSCGSNCSCGSGCSCGKKMLDDTALAAPREAGGSNSFGHGQSEGGTRQNTCKCGPNCSCDPCTC
ncbi:hypothetical protein GOP47_0002793 [Adiantum capillus-veneris]|uniref:Metallothionein-like protein n=1 Tax=Adiantum capillus-veneris TaxID=13818 RepID=A0A9D4ZRX9_ADICA|nr:hypothetical protein GOP47_0002793 [Adiantum capillus-veneris]